MSTKIAEPIDRREVVRRRTTVLYQLFEFIEQLSNEERVQQSHADVLQKFLLTHEAPKLTKIENKDCDGGYHDVQSLLPWIQNMVRMQTTQSEARSDPLGKFFAIGYRSISRSYYREIVETYKEYYPKAVVIDRYVDSDAEESRRIEVTSSSSPNETVQVSSSSLAVTPGLTELAANPKNVISSSELAQKPVSKRHNVQKELEALSRDSLHSDPPREHVRNQSKRVWSEVTDSVPRTSSMAPEAPPEAQSQDIFGEPETAIQRNAKVIYSKKRKGSLLQNDARASKPPDTTAMAAGETETEQEATSAFRHSSIRHPAPYSRTRITLSEIKVQMSAIHSSLWASLRDAFMNFDYQCHEPGQLISKPSHELDELYSVCLGPQWKMVVSGFGDGLEYRAESVDLFAALVGAIIYTRVFQGSITNGEDFNLSFGSSIYEKKVRDSLMEHGVNLPNMLHNAAIETVRDEDFRAQSIRPCAARLLTIVSPLLLEHLSHQPKVYESARYTRLPSQISEAISHALEGALFLTAELQAAREDVAYDWYHPGCHYDLVRMALGTHSVPVGVSATRKIAMTLLPRVGLRH